MEQLGSALAGRYSIDREVGSGGMATVYLARDLRHDRRVAIKVLNPELGAVLGVERFLAEIKVTANLQHPNLLPLFDSGEANGLLFYVMPFVEGESLRAKLDREQQLPIDEAVRIAVAVASALTYAHEHGVIHRDLKPENILLQSGQPMVADFGIALAVTNAGGSRVTQTGLSLGTPQYMSPEQAAGDRTIDGRSDIYSLAAVTYEMIAGEPPHSGPNAQAIISKLMTSPPQPLSALRSTAPGHVVAAVNVALAKLPADRFATAREFAEALGGTRPVRVYDAPKAASTSRRRLLIVGTASAMVLVGVAGAGYLVGAEKPARAVGRFIAELPEGIEFSLSAVPGIAISRDGTQLVFSGARSDAPEPGSPTESSGGLYYRRLDDDVARLIEGTEGAVWPSFSFDGQTLLFIRGNQLRRMPVNGGTSALVADSAGGGPASWGEDGRVAYTHSLQLWTVSANGGSPRIVAEVDSVRGIRGFLTPEVLPGGKHALVTVYKDELTAASANIAVVSLDDGVITETGVQGSNPHYAASGHVVFQRDQEALVAPFSLRKRAFTGEAVRLVDRVVATTTGRTDLAVSQSGVLVFRATDPSQGASRFVIVDRRGNETLLTRTVGVGVEPRISPDGRRVVSRDRAYAAVSGDLWVYDLESGAPTRLTSDGQSWRPEWTTDGTRVAFLSGSDVDATIVSRPWDANGNETVLLSWQVTGSRRIFQSLSLGPSHTFAAIRTGSRATTQSADIWIAPVDSLSNLRLFLSSPFFELEPAVSPDGQLLAYTSNQSGRYEVYVTPLPGPGPQVVVSLGGGTEPVWSPRSSGTLFYRGPTHMMEATVTQSPSLGVSRRDQLFPDGYRRYTGFAAYDVFPDGQRFLMTRDLSATARRLNRAVVIVNWPQLIARPSGNTR